MKHSQLLKQILALITPVPENMTGLALEEKRQDPALTEEMDWGNIRCSRQLPDFRELKQWSFIPNQHSIIDVNLFKPYTLTNVDNLLGRIELIYPNHAQSIKHIDVNVSLENKTLATLKSLITEQRDKLVWEQSCLDTAISKVNANTLLAYATDNLNSGTGHPAKTDNIPQIPEKKSYTIDEDVINLIGFIKQYLNKFTQNEQMRITHYNLGYQIASLYSDEIRIPRISDDSNEVNFLFAAISKKHETLIESGNIPLEDLADFWHERNRGVNSFILGYEEALYPPRRSRRDESDSRIPRVSPRRRASSSVRENDSRPNRDFDPRHDNDTRDGNYRSRNEAIKDFRL